MEAQWFNCSTPHAQQNSFANSLQFNATHSRSSQSTKIPSNMLAVRLLSPWFAKDLLSSTWKSFQETHGLKSSITGSQYRSISLGAGGVRPILQKRNLEMPNRILREGILASERIDALSTEAELFYRRLMSVVDDYGRFEANPKLLVARCFPLRTDRVTVSQVKQWLSDVSQTSDSGPPLVSVYVVQGKNYLQINEFKQRTRVESKFPEPSCLTNDRQMTAYARATTTTTAPTSNTSTPSERRKNRSANAVDWIPEGILASEPFHAFWERYRKLRDAGRQQIAAQMWLSLDCEEHAAEVFACLASYEVSRDAQNGAVQNADQWLRTVHESGWKATWPAPVTKKTSLEKIFEEMA
jgi:hypothetical protein